MWRGTEHTHTHTKTHSFKCLPPPMVLNRIERIKFAVLLLYYHASTKIHFFGEARCLLIWYLVILLKIVKKVKEMSRENASLEEKSMFLIHFNFSFYKFNYIQFYYKNPLSIWQIIGRRKFNWF